MKQFLLTSCLLVVSIFIVNAQYNTGDSQLNASLIKIDEDANTDFKLFRADISVAYNVPEKKIDSWFVDFGLKGGDCFLIVEIAKITKRPVDEVVNVYQANKTKGWGAIAKELGIKPGSPEFHALKNSAGSKASKPSKSKAKGKKG